MDGPREKYREALKGVQELRDQHPRLHEAVRALIAEALGQEVQRFYGVPAEKAAEEGVRSHAAHRALNGVYATLCSPEGRIAGLDNPPVKKGDPVALGDRQRLYDRFANGLKRKLGLVKDPAA